MMELIDQGGKRVRPACDICHRVRVKVKVGKSRQTCTGCRYEEWLQQKRADARFLGLPAPRRRKRQA